MSATPFALLPPLPAPKKGLPSVAWEGWGGVLFASNPRALPPPNLPLQAGGGARASTRPSPQSSPQWGEEANANSEEFY
jgi:hypothetical protein